MKRIPEPIDHGAVSGHDENLTMILPEGEGLALLDLDRHLARKELADGRFLHKRQRLEPGADVPDIGKGQRRFRREAGGRQNLRLAQFAQAGNGDPIDAEAERAGENVLRLAIFGTRRLDPAAAHDAVKADGGEQADDTGRAEAGGNAPRKRGRDEAATP